MQPRVAGVFLPMTLAVASAWAAPPDCPLPASTYSLAQAELRLAACNREMRDAAAALEAAQADRVVAGQRPNPTLTVGANNLNPALGIGPGPLRDKTFDSAVRVEQVLERGGKAELRERQADALVAASRADAVEAARAQRLAMRTAFFDLALAQERVHVQRDFGGLSAESVRASERRLAAGDISTADANRMRLDATRAANDLRQARADLERARQDLARLLASEATASSLEVVAPEALPSPALGRAGTPPAIVAARKRVEAAEAARDLAKSLATRDVTLGVQADHWPTSATNLQGTGNSFGFTVSIPLQVRHANEGEARKALADLDAARLALAKAEAAAGSESRLAETDWAAAQERQQRNAAEAVPLAHEVARASEFAYTRGATGILDLLEARRSLRAVELDAAVARADAAKAWARREAALETVPE